MKVLIDIPEEYYDVIKQISDKSCTADMLIIKYGTPIPDNATPCEFCRYNPPSSTDGKPCCMCPATGRGKLYE